jgi:hypothetical protein
LQKLYALGIKPKSIAFKVEYIGGDEAIVSKAKPICYNNNQPDIYSPCPPSPPPPPKNADADGGEK